ncbi:MurR/RpiR family transcriptional regulator [Mesoplasma syrphidae]|uniref:MurR/RpiR family transcriptional regulator n=1 Tax=Mesoplasma syrphidae TaxID=225999 RepID=A0A2K9BPB2_9MOLU|nr:MurR/RpiR family transcriptional regulator [Mesoplasma syrphidae]AUF83873.1 MurR/RpiR family transcriptional regulator [Mesoplasma syrphidae]
MNSILDSIFIISTSQKNTVSKSISEELLKAFETKEVLNIKLLANKCFVAQSSVTKFAKQLGFSGYRELQTKLKMEIHDRRDICKNEILFNGTHYDNIEERIVQAIYDFRVYKTIIKKIANNILKSRKVFIFSSYIAFSEAKSMHDIFLLKNINVVYSEVMLYNFQIHKSITKNDFVIFIVSGQDTKGLEKIYDNLKQEEVSHCVFLSHSKTFKFNESSEKIVIDHQLLPHMPEIRKVLLNYIILQIATELQ